LIQSWIDEDCGITLKSIQQRCQSQLNINVSIASLHRAINNFNYSFKRTSLVPEKRNDPDVILQRKQYVIELNRLTRHIKINYKLFFIDEAGFNVSMRTFGGRSMRGTCAVHVVPGFGSRNISLCAAMSSEGLVKYKTQTVAYNTSSFYTFVEELLIHLTQQEVKNIVLVMDNVPFHKPSIIKNLVVSFDAKILFLPSYSPFLNPIENLFANGNNVSELCDQTVNKNC